MRLRSKALIALCAGTKGIYVPEGGWTEESFASHGHLLIAGLSRVAKTVQRKGIRDLSRIVSRLIRQHAEDVIGRVEKIRAGTFSRKAEEGSTEFAFLDAAWALALEQVMAEAAIEIVVELTPPIQSVMAQGYSKVNLLLGQEVRESINGDIAREARGIAERITRTNETTRKQFETIIRESITAGDSVAETATVLREKVRDIASWRSLTIARTELNNAWTQGAVASFQQSKAITHCSVIGCEAREPGSPQYRGESTCNIQDVPLSDLGLLTFHINHTGNLVPSKFRKAGR